MITTKLGFGLSLTAALCLMACGDDTSSFSPAPQDNPEETLSSSSETSDIPESSEDAGTSSSSLSASSSSAEAVTPCAFTATDKVWEMSYTANDGKGDGKIKTVYEIQGDDLVIRDTVRYTGSQANIVCRLSDGPKDFTSGDGNFTATQFCDGSTVVIAGTVQHKGYFAGKSLEAIHATVQKACDVAVNGGTYEAVPLETTTICDFTVEDSVWSYSYLDEGWRGQDSVIVHQSFIKSEDIGVKAEQHPLQHVQCVAENFTSISSNNYCSAEGLMDLSSSGLLGEWDSIYDREMNYCKEKMPAVQLITGDSLIYSDTTALADTAIIVQPDTAVIVSPDTSANIDTASTNPAVITVDMVSCNIPGVMGECLEFPAGSDEAEALKSTCKAVMEGTIGTGCN